jgi:hypothetical protein
MSLRQTSGGIESLRQAHRRDSASVIHCHSRERFVAACHDDHDLIIWRRPLPQCLIAWLNKIDPHELPELRILVNVEDIRRALIGEMDRDGPPRSAMRELLISDIAMLSDAFAQLAGLRQVDIRLERIQDNACRLFHRDNVRVRVLTTYRGPSTEWVEPEFPRMALRASGRFCFPIRRLDDLDVAVFKGSQGDPDRGVVHRSPPIEGTGETRLLLCLNEASKVSPAPWRAGW